MALLYEHHQRSKGEKSDKLLLCTLQGAPLSSERDAAGGKAASVALAAADAPGFAVAGEQQSRRTTRGDDRLERLEGLLRVAKQELEAMEGRLHEGSGQS